MHVFETSRLSIRPLEEKDKTEFIEIQTNPKIIDPSPDQVKSLDEVVSNFEMNLKLGKVPKKGCDNIWGVFLIESTQMIGLGAILTNELNEWEIGYRLKLNFWGQGFGSELAKGLIDYCLLNLKLEKITAVVDVKNKASVKILEKYMVYEKEYYNSIDECTDRKYSLRMNTRP